MKDALGAVQSVIVLGGTSEIGVAIATELARARAATVVLAGRRPDALEEAAATLRSAGAGAVHCTAFNALDTAGHGAALDVAWQLAGGDVDVIVLAFGALGDQQQFEDGDAGRMAAVEVATTNYVGGVSAGLAVAARLKSQGHGTLMVLSSVAGERVRRANFVYGSSKAGLDGFAQGLGDSLVGTGASVLVVRPGFVHSRMTAGMDAAPFATTPDAVATAAVKAFAAGKEVVWAPGVLRAVFAAFRHLPRPLWRRVPG